MRPVPGPHRQLEFLAPHRGLGPRCRCGWRERVGGLPHRRVARARQRCHGAVQGGPRRRRQRFHGGRSCSGYGCVARGGAQSDASCLRRRGCSVRNRARPARRFLCGWDAWRCGRLAPGHVSGAGADGAVRELGGLSLVLEAMGHCRDHFHARQTKQRAAVLRDCPTRDPPVWRLRAGVPCPPASGSRGGCGHGGMVPATVAEARAPSRRAEHGVRVDGAVRHGCRGAAERRTGATRRPSSTWGSCTGSAGPG